MNLRRIVKIVLVLLVVNATVCLARPPKVIIDTDFNTIGDDGGVPGQAHVCEVPSWRLLSDGCGDHRPTIGRRKEPPLYFSPSVQQDLGHPPPGPGRT